MRLAGILSTTVFALALSLASGALAQPSETPAPDRAVKDRPERQGDALVDQSDVGRGVSEDAKELRDAEDARNEAAQRLRRRALERNEGFRRGLEDSDGAAGNALERGLQDAPFGSPRGLDRRGGLEHRGPFGPPEGVGPPRGVGRPDAGPAVRRGPGRRAPGKGKGGGPPGF